MQATWVVNMFQFLTGGPDAAAGTHASRAALKKKVDGRMPIYQGEPISIFDAVSVDLSVPSSADNRSCASKPVACAAAQPFGEDPGGWPHRAYGYEDGQSIGGSGW